MLVDSKYTLFMKLNILLVSTMRSLLQLGTRALNSQANHLAFVATGLFDLCSRATPVVPELGGGRHAKHTLAEVVDGPVPIHALPRPRYLHSSRRTSPASLDFPTTPGARERGSP
jgi:hypothetical protein